MGGNSVKPLKTEYDDKNRVEVDSFEGPIKDRKCRDVIFLILFIAILGGMGYTAFLALRYGPPDCLKFDALKRCKSANCLLDLCFPKPKPNLSGLLLKIGIEDQKLIKDFQLTWKEICYMILLTVGVVLVLCVLLRFFAGVIIWMIVIAVPLALAGVCVYAWITYNYFHKHPQDPKENPGVFEKSQTWLGIGISLSVILVIFLLVILVLRKRISLVIQLFKEAGKSLASMPFLFIQPLWTFIIAIGCLAGLLYIFLAMEFSESPKTNGHDSSEIFKYLRWYHIFGSLWILFFIISCQEFVIASSVSMWYFCREKKKLSIPILRSIYRLIRYHLGSIAIGSFLIAILTFLRIILGVIQRRLENSKGSVLTFMLKCCQCCLWCFEKMLKFLNRNAYIQIAIYGHGFCKAARSAFSVITSNALRLTAINSVGDFVLFIAKIGTVTCAGGVGYELIKDKKDLNYLWLPITCICLIAYLIAACFFSVFEMAIDTLFICFCEDCDMNDGITKPFYMSKDLMRYVESSKTALKEANSATSI